MDVSYVGLVNDTPLPEDDCEVCVGGNTPPIMARLKRVWVQADGTETPATQYDLWRCVGDEEE